MGKRRENGEKREKSWKLKKSGARGGEETAAEKRVIFCKCKTKKTKQKNNKKNRTKQSGEPFCFAQR